MAEDMHLEEQKQTEHAIFSSYSRVYIDAKHFIKDNFMKRVFSIIQIVVFEKI